MEYTVKAAADFRGLQFDHIITMRYTSKALPPLTSIPTVHHGRPGEAAADNALQELGLTSGRLRTS